jgi:hypothetical protein
VTMCGDRGEILAGLTAWHRDGNTIAVISTALSMEQIATLSVKLQQCGTVRMSKSILQEVREVLWLASLVGGLSAAGIGIGVSLAVV